jgi:hypothetical protein
MKSEAWFELEYTNTLELVSLSLLSYLFYLQSTFFLSFFFIVLSYLYPALVMSLDAWLELEHANTLEVVSHCSVTTV